MCEWLHVALKQGLTRNWWFAKKWLFIILYLKSILHTVELALFRLFLLVFVLSGGRIKLPFKSVCHSPTLLNDDRCVLVMLWYIEISVRYQYIVSLRKYLNFQHTGIDFLIYHLAKFLSIWLWYLCTNNMCLSETLNSKHIFLISRKGCHKLPLERTH